MSVHLPISKPTNPLSLWERANRRADWRSRVEAVKEILASGGLKDGLDIAKCIALGATLGRMAGQFLKAATISTEKAVEMIKLTKKQIEVTMFACGA